MKFSKLGIVLSVAAGILGVLFWLVYSPETIGFYIAYIIPTCFLMSVILSIILPES